MHTRSRRLLPTLLLAAVAALWTASPASAQDDSYEEMPGVTKSGTIPGDTTITNGTVPKEIVGRWVAILESTPMTNQDQKGRGEASTVRTFEIVEADDGYVLNLHRGQLPDAVKEKLDPRSVPKRVKSSPGAAPAGAPKSPPDAATLGEVAKAWPGLLAPEAEPRIVASRMINYDMVTPADKEKLGEAGTQFFIVLDEGFKESKTVPRQAISTMAVKDLDKTHMSGKSLQAIMLRGQNRGDMAFPPVAVAFGGDFVAYRLPDADGGTATGGSSAPKTESKGFLGGLFSGCNS